MVNPVSSFLGRGYRKLFLRQKSRIENHAIIVVRYSVILRGHQRAWKVGRGVDLNEYAQRILAPDRLVLRRSLFLGITLPSVAAAIKAAPEIKSQLHILTTTLLPEDEKRFLAEVARKYPFVRIYFLSPDHVSLSSSTSEVRKKLPQDAVIASIRLDDDDGISPDFLKRLGRYMKPPYHGHVISFCNGFGGRIDEAGRVSEVGGLKWRFGAAGLALVYQNNRSWRCTSIYMAGSHDFMDDKFPTILDARTPSFFRAYHFDNDSKSKFEKDVSEVLSEEKAADVLRSFSISAENIMRGKLPAGSVAEESREE